MSHLTPAKPYLDFNLFNPHPELFVQVGAIWEVIPTAVAPFENIWRIEECANGRVVLSWYGSQRDSGRPWIEIKVTDLLKHYQFVTCEESSGSEEPVDLEVALRLGEEAFG